MDSMGNIKSKFRTRGRRRAREYQEQEYHYITSDYTAASTSLKHEKCVPLTAVMLHSIAELVIFPDRNNSNQTLLANNIIVAIMTTSYYPMM